MPSLIARNIFICVVPTVLALLSVYWFRKKKFKPKVFPLSSKHANSDISCNITDSNSIDTLSVNCLSSHDSQEQSLRTTNVTKVCSESPIISETNHVGAFVNHVQPKEHLCDVQPLNVLGNHAPENMPLQTDVDKSILVVKQCVPELDSLPQFSDKSSNGNENFSFNYIQKLNDTSINVEKCIQDDVMSIISTLENICNVNNKHPSVTQNGCSDLSSLDDTLSHNVELEKFAVADTDSNDSHSSVLDENSSSYASDDSDSRNAKVVKNENLSGVDNKLGLTVNLCLDRDSKDDFLHNNSMLAVENHLDVKDTSKDSDENVNSSQTETNLTLLGIQNSTESTPMDITQSNSSNRCLKTQSSDCSVQESANSEENDYSVDSQNKVSDTQNFSSMGSKSISDGEKIAEEFSFLDDLVNQNQPCTSVLMSAEKSICDNSSSSDTASSKSSDISNGNLMSDTDPLMVNSKKEDSSVSGNDSQITEMNIMQHLNPISSKEISMSSHYYETDADHTEILSRSKLEPCIAGSKVPESLTNAYRYEFELPQELCGRLIGKSGKHVKSIKERSNANVFIKRHPFDPQLKVVVIEGNQSDVKEALDIIRRKYPLSRYPALTLGQTNMLSSTGVAIPESLPLHLPEGVSCDVVMSSLVSAGHFFLQQPTHPTYPSLSTLDQCMMNCYSQSNTPLMPHPVEAGVICAAPALQGWYRAQVIGVMDNGNECALKFVDYGGFSQVPTSALRQIRSDFMSLPFQASECYLANVHPVDRNEGWSAEATATFEELAQGQILQALLVDYAEDGIPCVHLYRVQGISSMFINKELVERGLAIWANSGHWDPH